VHLKSPLRSFHFVVYDSVFTTHRSQQKGETSRKSRADLERNSF